MNSRRPWLRRILSLASGATGLRVDDLCAASRPTVTRGAADTQEKHAHSVVSADGDEEIDDEEGLGDEEHEENREPIGDYETAKRSLSQFASLVGPAMDMSLKRGGSDEDRYLSAVMGIGGELGSLLLGQWLHVRCLSIQSKADKIVLMQHLATCFSREATKVTQGEDKFQEEPGSAHLIDDPDATTNVLTGPENILLESLFLGIAHPVLDLSAKLKTRATVFLCEAFTSVVGPARSSLRLEVARTLRASRYISLDFVRDVFKCLFSSPPDDDGFAEVAACALSMVGLGKPKKIVQFLSSSGLFSYLPGGHGEALKALLGPGGVPSKDGLDAATTLASLEDADGSVARQLVSHLLFLLCASSHCFSILLSCCWCKGGGSCVPRKR